MRRERPVVVEGMRGLGDNVYQRAIIRDLPGPVYLATPWPQLYTDLPQVRPVRPNRHGLRTQLQNELAQPPGTWWDRPPEAPRLTIRYGDDTFRRGDTMLQGMEMGVQALRRPGGPLQCDLPVTQPWPRLSRPLAIIRPVTHRTEWLNVARAPDPAYIAQLAARLMDTHHVVAVGDVADRQEWVVGDMPPCHEALMHGELGVLQLVALMRRADVVVAGVGWALPMAVATNTRAYIVLGGNGGANHPDRITDPRLDNSRLGWAVPSRFCLCHNMRHGCDKRVPDLVPGFEAWARQQGVKI